MSFFVEVVQCDFSFMRGKLSSDLFSSNPAWTIFLLPSESAEHPRSPRPGRGSIIFQKPTPVPTPVQGRGFWVFFLGVFFGGRGVWEGEILFFLPQ